MEKYGYSSDFDSLFEKSEFIKLYPFVGRNYQNMSTKIMVLGESHYIDPELDISNYSEAQLKELDDDKYYSRSVLMDDYFANIREDGTNPNKWIQCYRNTAAMITGMEYHDSDYVWNNLSFYNFFQSSIGHGAGSQKFITPELIEDSRKAYFEVITILKPDFIIAWGLGKLYYKWVPEDGYIEMGEYTYKYKEFPNTLIWHIKHPSRSFSYEKYHDSFMKKVNELGLDISDVVKQ